MPDRVPSLPSGRGADHGALQTVAGGASLAVLTSSTAAYDAVASPPEAVRQLLPDSNVLSNYRCANLNVGGALASHGFAAHEDLAGGAGDDAAAHDAQAPPAHASITIQRSHALDSGGRGGAAGPGAHPVPDCSRVAALCPCGPCIQLCSTGEPGSGGWRVTVHRCFLHAM